MCLYLNMHLDGERPKSKKAEKEIKVYKLLCSNSGVFSSPFRSFEYKEGYHYTEKKFDIKYSSFDIFKRWPEVHKGLHAYTTLGVARAERSTKEVIVEMYIPEGASYFKSRCGEEIASTDLIWYEGAKIHKK